ncbi:Peroxygenase 1 [Cryptotrichosporon argae]
MSYKIAKAVEGDIPEILQLIVDLAVYEKEPDAVIATPELMRKNLFENRYAEAFVARETSAGKAVGFALYFFTYSTWLGKPGLYLEDLYVSPEHRGGGLGKLLFGHLGEEARARDCLRVEWRVLKWNQPSIDFYEKRLGSERLDEWHTMRIEGVEGIDKLAALKQAA